MAPELLILILISLFAVGFIIIVIHHSLTFSIYKRIKEKHPATWRKFESPDLNFRSFIWFSGFRNNPVNHMNNLKRLLEYLSSHKDARWLRDKELDRKVSQMKTTRLAFSVFFVILVAQLLITLYLTSP